MESVLPDIDGGLDRDKAEDVPEPVTYSEILDARDVDPDAAKVIRRLTRHGHTAYLVGGGVRDLLLDRPPKDFDLATSARPEEVRRLFRNCRIIGRRFRLAHILFAGRKVIETATFRRDPGVAEYREGDGSDVPDDADLLIRHDNVFGEPHEDAVRRDFTINGLFYDLEHDEVIDYVGGVPDLRASVVRTIGPAGVRIREDPVRILRAIKFAARLDFELDPALYDAIVTHREELERSARPRVLEEVLRLMRGGAAHGSIDLCWDTGVLAVVLPELASFLDDHAPGSEATWGRLEAIDRRQCDGELPSDAVLFASLLAAPIAEWMEGSRDPSVAFEEFFDGIGERLAVPRRLKDRVRSIVVAQRRLRSGKLGALPRRDFFVDAATFLALDLEAAGEPLPDWIGDLKEAPPSRERRPGRRRRRR